MKKKKQKDNISLNEPQKDQKNSDEGSKKMPIKISNKPTIEKGPIRVKRQDKFPSETAVPTALITADQGIIEIRRVEELSGELLKNPDVKVGKKKRPDIIYSGWNPTTIVIYSNLFPRWFQKLLGKPKLRLKGYFNLKHEPITRNPFTGEILDPVKKKSVLVERGIIDSEGWLLDHDGERIGYDSYWLKVDVSDIDFIKSEFHAYFQSEAEVKAAQAMKRTGQTLDDMWKWIIISAFVCIAFIVFTMSGGL